MKNIKTVPFKMRTTAEGNIVISAIDPKSTKDNTIMYDILEATRDVFPGEPDGYYIAILSDDGDWRHVARKTVIPYKEKEFKGWLMKLATAVYWLSMTDPDLEHFVS